MFVTSPRRARRLPRRRRTARPGGRAAAAPLRLDSRREPAPEGSPRSGRGQATPDLSLLRSVSEAPRVWKMKAVSKEVSKRVVSKDSAVLARPGPDVLRPVASPSVEPLASPSRGFGALGSFGTGGAAPTSETLRPGLFENQTYPPDPNLSPCPPTLGPGRGERPGSRTRR